MNHPVKTKKYCQEFETDFKYEYLVPGLSMAAFATQDRQADSLRKSREVIAWAEKNQENRVA